MLLSLLAFFKRTLNKIKDHNKKNINTVYNMNDLHQSWKRFTKKVLIA